MTSKGLAMLFCCVVFVSAFNRISTDEDASPRRSVAGFSRRTCVAFEECANSTSNCRDSGLTAASSPFPRPRWHRLPPTNCNLEIFHRDTTATFSFFMGRPDRAFSIYGRIKPVEISNDKYAGQTIVASSATRLTYATFPSATRFPASISV